MLPEQIQFELRFAHCWNSGLHGGMREACCFTQERMTPLRSDVGTMGVPSSSARKASDDAGDAEFCRRRNSQRDQLRMASELTTSRRCRLEFRRALAIRSRMSSPLSASMLSCASSTSALLNTACRGSWVLCFLNPSQADPAEDGSSDHIILWRVLFCWRRRKLGLPEFVRSCNA